MASNSKDDVVIVKVENGKRTNSTSDAASPSQSRKKRKLLTLSSSTDEVLSIDCDTRKINSTDYSSCTGRGEGEGKKNKVRVEDNENQPSAVNNITEEIRVLEENGTISSEDVALIEQQMLDRALALSLEQEELEKLSRSHISNEREYPTSNNTSLPSRVSPECSNNLMNSSQPLTSHTETTSSLELIAAETVTDNCKEFELPMHWQPMPENCPKNYELFMVLPDTEEYNTVTQKFLHQPLSVYSVKRIQNLEFLKRYTLEKKLILSVRGKDFNINEQRLFHTSTANPDDICEQGLDNRLSRSGGSFGAGIYFSDDVLKCHCYWRHSFQPALMFQCRVILGDIKEYPRGVRDVGLRREPEKVVRNPGEQRTYDSVKGNITGRNEFVVYNTYRVMPEYMIEYTFTKNSHQIATRQPMASHHPHRPPLPIPAAVPTDQNDPRYLNILSTMKKKGRGRGHK